MRNIVRALTAVATGVLILAGTATSAQAASFTKRCDEIPGQTTLLACSMAIPSFPGGTMSIDVDANGSGTGHWILFKHGSLRACETDYDLVAPAQSWVCHNLGADNYVLYNVVQPSSTWARQGVRW